VPANAPSNTGKRPVHPNPRTTTMTGWAAWRGAAAALFALGAIIAAPPAPAAAQSPQQEASQPGPPSSARENRAEPDALRWAGLFAEANGLIDLRLTPTPDAEAYELACRTFAIASDLAPGDAQIARRWAQAAWSASMEDDLRRASRRVVRAAPGDTVAQLRVVSDAVNRAQTVEGRLEKLEAFLGPRGSGIAPEVRSRLALEAATLRRERGDADAFAERLSSAIRLDPAHKEAVALALSYYTAQVGEPEGTLDLLIRLLYADPFDAKTAVRIAEVLAREAAMDQARRYHDLAWNLVIKMREPGAELYAQRYALVWDDEGPGAVTRDIARRLEEFRAIAEARYEAGVERDVPEDELIEPEDVHLPSITEITRTIAAVEAGDEEQIEQGLAELEAISDQRIEDRLNNPGRPELRTAAIRAFTDLMIMRLFAGREVDAVVRSMTELRRDGQGELISDIALAWLALRRDGPEAAFDALETINPANPYAIMLEAVAGEALGRTETAVRAARELARAQPLGVYGAWGRYRLRRLLGDEPIATPPGRRLAATASAVPDWVLELHDDPLSFVGLRVEAVESLGRSFPQRVRVTLRNTSPLPLAVGADRPLGSRILLSTNATSSQRVLGRRRPEVVELNHRLTLADGEAMTATLRPSVGANLILDLANADRPVSRRWSAVQSFVLGSRQTIEPGPFARADRTDPRVVRPVPEAAMPPAELAAAVRDTEAGERGWLVFGAASVLWRASMPAEGTRAADAPGVSELIAALAETLPTMSRGERLLALSAAPSAAQLPAMAPFDRAALAHASALLDGPSPPHSEIALALLTRVADHEHALLRRATDSDASELARLAELLAARLRSNTPSRATAGPGPGALSAGARLEAIGGQGAPTGRPGSRADDR